MSLNSSQKIGTFVGASCGLYLGVLSSEMLVDFLYEYEWLSMEYDTIANHAVAASAAIIAPLSILLAAEAGLVIASKLASSRYNSSISQFNLGSLWKSANLALESFVDSSVQQSYKGDDKIAKIA